MPYNTHQFNIVGVLPPTEARNDAGFVVSTPEEIMTGRLSEYSQETADIICTRIAEGESLRSICRDEAMPSLSTVFKWLAAFPAFADQYTRAREAQADTLADEIVDIADDGKRDYIQTESGPVVDHDHIARSRLRVDARKWIASKLKPKKYGDRTELTGPGGAPLSPPILNLIIDGKRIEPAPVPEAGGSVPDNRD